MVQKLKVLAYCNECNKETNQENIFSEKVQEIFPEAGKEVIYSTEYRVNRCLGCDFISFEKVDYDTLTIDKDGEPIKSSMTYPEPDEYEDELFLDSELANLPKVIRGVYEEVQYAYESECFLLCGLGLRTLVEAICVHQKFEHKNLKLKIDNLFKSGLISKRNVDTLHKLREIGNVTAHQIKTPQFKTIEAAIEVVNHILREMYVIPKRSKKLEKPEYYKSQF